MLAVLIPRKVLLMAEHEARVMITHPLLYFAPLVPTAHLAVLIVLLAHIPASTRAPHAKRKSCRLRRGNVLALVRPG